MRLVADHGRVAYVVAAGAWLGMLQVLTFTALQMLLSSAYQTYLTVVVAWLVGAAIGVWIPPGRWSRAMPLLSVAATMTLLLLLAAFPFASSLLPILAILIATTALYAGHLFVVEQARFPQVGRLFFWENNGFVLGLLVGSLAVVVGGRQLLFMVPVLGGCSVLLLDRYTARGQSLKSVRRPLWGSSVPDP